jgi:hypothetical protein
VGKDVLIRDIGINATFKKSQEPRTPSKRLQTSSRRPGGLRTSTAIDSRNDSIAD